MSSLISLSLLLLLACGDKDDDTGTPTGDGGATDGGASDGGTTDGGTSDGGTSDGGTSDGGTSDGGTADGGTTDGGTTDGGTTDGGTTDGGTTDGGTSDGGTSDGGTGAYSLSSGRYVLSIGDLIEDTCVSGGSGEALPSGASAPVDVFVSGSDLTIEISGGADISLTGTVDAGTVSGTQETTTDFRAIGYDCVLEYRWWLDATLSADDHAAGSMGLDYTPVGGAGCGELAAEDGWTLPCGWSVEASLSPAR